MIGYVGRPTCHVVRLQPAGGVPTRSCETPRLACSLWAPAVAFKPRSIASTADPFVFKPLQPAQQAASRLFTSACGLVPRLKAPLCSKPKPAVPVCIDNPPIGRRPLTAPPAL